MIINANALHIPLADRSVQCIVTSPPYWGLRDYGTAKWEGGDPECKHSFGTQVGQNNTGQHETSYIGGVRPGADARICKLCGAIRIDNQLGLERTPEEYIANMVAVFRECWRVLRDDGTLWLNVGDSYASDIKGSGGPSEKQLSNNGSRYTPIKLDHGLKPKDLVGIPWRLAFALQADGWYLRSDIIWSKPNPMPESVTDRPTKSHEYLFLLAKQERYYYDQEAIREDQLPESFDRYKYNFGQPRQYERAEQGYQNLAWNDGVREINPSGRNRRTVWTIPTAPYSTGVKISRWRRVSSDVVSDGTMHIVLPDCPIHAGLFDRVANDFCGEYEGDLLTRIKHIYYRLVQDRANGHRNKPGNNGHLVASQDYLSGSYSPSAIDHNNEIHRMALDLGSNSAYIPFFEIADRIDDRLELLASFVRHLCIFENSILPDDLGARLLDRTPHRIVDKFSLPIPSECKCLYYEHYTRGAEHFATFPPALVEPCIKAGTSERGACPKCGKGWRRVIDRQDKRHWTERNEYTESKYKLGDNGSGRNDGRADFAIPKMDTLGWQPACTCDAGDPIPCLVFDPFVGSGTTVKVAYDLGRRGVGLDLSLDYLDEQARKRIHNGHTARLF